jgi:TPR repeat protein
MSSNSQDENKGPRFGHQFKVLTADERELLAIKKYEEMVAREPLPKLFGGVESAGHITMEYDFHSRLTNNKAYKNGDEWRSAMGISNNKNPVWGRMYSLPSIPGGKSNSRTLWEKANQELRKMDNELNQLGCNTCVIITEQTHQNAKGHTKTDARQYHLFLPRQIPRKRMMGIDRSDPVENIEQAAIMLAYLLKKGLVTEKEVKEQYEWSQEACLDRFAAFSTVILMMAKSPEVQAKIRSLELGATAQPSLP